MNLLVTSEVAAVWMTLLSEIRPSRLATEVAAAHCEAIIIRWGVPPGRYSIQAYATCKVAVEYVWYSEPVEILDGVIER